MDLYGLDDLTTALAATDNGASAGLLRAWSNGRLLAWLRTRNFHGEPPDRGLLNRIEELVKRVPKDTELALFALGQLLEPSRPLTLLSGIAVPTPGHLEEVLNAHPRQLRALMAALSRLVIDGRLVEWIRASEFPGSQSLIDRLAARPQSTVKDLEPLPGYAARWLCDPRAPFPTSDGEAADPKALATWLGAAPERRGLAFELLKSGWLGLWLTSTGRLTNDSGLKALMTENLSDAARIETLLCTLDPARPRAIMEAEPAALKIGNLARNSKTEVRLTITNRGSGYLWGTFALEGNAASMRLQSLNFEGSPATQTLMIDTAGVPPFTECEANIRIDGYDGGGFRQLQVPVSYRVTVPVLPKVGRSLLTGSIVGAALALLRLTVGQIQNGRDPAGVTSPLHWMSLDSVSKMIDRSIDQVFGFVFTGLLLAGVLAGTLVYLIRARRR